MMTFKAQNVISGSNSLKNSYSIDTLNKGARNLRVFSRPFSLKLSNLLAPTWKG